MVAFRKPRDKRSGPNFLETATVTLADGDGDGIGVVPVLSAAGIGGVSVYALVHRILLAARIFPGEFSVPRPGSPDAVDRWGHILPSGVQIGVGLLAPGGDGTPGLGG